MVRQKKQTDPQEVVPEPTTDDETTGKPCKHMLAVGIVRQRDAGKSAPETACEEKEKDDKPKAKRRREMNEPLPRARVVPRYGSLNKLANRSPVKEYFTVVASVSCRRWTCPNVRCPGATAFGPP